MERGELGLRVMVFVGLVSIGQRLVVSQTVGKSSTTVSPGLNGTDSQCTARYRDCAEERRRCFAESNTTSSTVTDVKLPTSITPDLRLPTSFTPGHYNLELQTYMGDPDKSNWTFRGSVKMWIRCDVASSNVTLHGKNLTIDNGSIIFQGAFSGYTRPSFKALLVDEKREFLIIQLDGTTEANKVYTLSMDYKAPLDNKMDGFYKSSYKQGGVTKYMASTHFQPASARKVFPCFDEPAFKSTFNITLVRPNNFKSISNMPIINSSATFVERGVTYVKDVYLTTKKMSTYLLSFVVADFSFTSRTRRNGLLLRAWSRTDAVESTRLALDYGDRVLGYFENFFNINFPLPKQDFIAMPNFPFGAMENWGLVAFKEKYMLYTEGVSSEDDKIEISMTVAHELAHMWFGNLVTPKWWDDLWLNEGFATFVSLLGANYLNPDWRLTDYFVTSYQHKGLAMDGLISSHPVFVAEAKTPGEILDIFDDVTYFKSASMIRMMRQFLGVEAFQKGVNTYLAERQFGGATHDDLWSAMTEQARQNRMNIDVKKVMDNWLLQMNYPVVTVKRSAQSPNSVQVVQQRYLQNYQTSDKENYQSPFNYTWDIPLTFTTSREPNFDQTERDVKWMWRNETSKSIALDRLNNADWFICNPLQTGFYRVNYDNKNWLALINQLRVNHEVIPAINRAQLINDAWGLAKSKLVDIKTALSVTDYLDKEREEAPWKAARTELDYLKVMLSTSQTYGPFQNFMQRKLTDQFRNFCLKSLNLSHNEIISRNLIAEQSCQYMLKECLDAASRLFTTWMDNPGENPIDLNLRKVVYCSAISVGGKKEWNFALEMLNRTIVSSERQNLLLALTCSQHEWILSSFLQSIFESNSLVRQQDVATVLIHASKSSLGSYLAWNFFKENYNELKNILENSIGEWSKLIKAVTERFNTPFQLQELTSFQKSQENYGSRERPFQQAVEIVQSNIKWMNESLPDVRDWLLASGY